MSRKLLAVAMIGLSLAGLARVPSASAAAERLALVIGNGGYIKAPRLPNPVDDAKSVADELRKLGFTVVSGYDLDIAKMRAKLSQFADELPGTKIALVFYAGHGVSVDEENYLLPTDIELHSPSDLDLNAISVGLLMKQMKRDEHANIIILDACRDNPFADELTHSTTRSLVGARGLSSIGGDAARGTMIAFASDPKSAALDGEAGHHSPFTEALLAHLADPGAPIDTVMTRVRAAVWEKTQHKQLPWVNTSLLGEIDLNPALASTAPPPPVVASLAPAPSPDAATRLRSDSALAVGTLEGERGLNLTSADVVKLQRRLRFLGLLKAPADGDLNGAATRAAIGDWQLSAGVAPTRLLSVGQVKALLAAEPKAPDEAALAREIGSPDAEKGLTLSADDVREIQLRLSLLQFLAGAPSGAFDKPTRNAIGAWQKSRGLIATGALGALQLTALKIQSEDIFERASAHPTAVAETPTKPKKPERPRPTPVARVERPEPPLRRPVAKADEEAPPPPYSPATPNPVVNSLFLGAMSGIIRNLPR